MGQSRTKTFKHVNAMRFIFYSYQSLISTLHYSDFIKQNKILGSKMKLWLAIMLVLVTQRPDVESKPKPKGSMAHYIGILNLFFQKCLKVGQKMGTRKTFKTFTIPFILSQHAEQLLFSCLSLVSKLSLSLVFMFMLKRHSS